MYWWNVSALAEDLKANRLSQRQQMGYLLANMLLVAFISETAPWIGEPVTPSLVVELVLVVLITVWGVRACYRANRQGDDAAFIARLICLSWPLSVRLVVLGLAIYAVYLTAGYVAFGNRFDAATEQTNVIDVVILTGLELLWYRWMRSRLRWIAGAGSR